MLKLKSIKLSDLRVNKSNDRHGELVDESAGIGWLLANHASHMRNLTKDIVEYGEIYEPPLVREESGVFVVYDGNRRTTALKLLSDPASAPETKWQRFFAAQRKLFAGEIPKSIQCQVEDDPDRLDEILYRRHTGSLDGVGQSQWDQPAKRNFVRRTGKHTDLDIAEEIERLLKTHGRLNESDRVKRSNLNRLLSSERFWGRVGIAVEDQKIAFTHKHDKVLDALEHIARDLMDERVVLKDIWKNDDKTAYLDRLHRKRILPTEKDRLEEKEKPDATPPENPKPQPRPKPKPRENRKHLIRDIDLGIEETSKNRRALDIISELQHDLEFGRHDNAIAVLFRVLIELSIDAYVSRSGSSLVNENDKLSKRFSKVLADMLASSLIEKKYFQALKKFEQSEPVFSAHTFNAYVHNKDFFPSENHLKSMWDTVETFIIICLKG